MSLLDELRDAGLIVRPDPGWETATNNNRDRIETVGVISHWDAVKGSPPVSYYTEKNRFGGILYHILIRRNGTVDLLSQRYVWHAGDGDFEVLEACRHNIIPPPPTQSNILGNRYFFSVAVNYHPDDGLMLQYDQLVTVNQVLLAHFGLSTNQVIDHRGWTTRKRDIDTISMKEFRSNIGDTMPLTATDFEAIRKLFREELDRQIDGKPGDPNSFYGVGQRVVSTLIGRSGRNVGQHLQDTLDTVTNLVDHDLDDSGFVKKGETVVIKGFQT